MEQVELIRLINKSRQGDPDAQEKLVTETQNRVYYHCKKFLKNEEDALDATQDVLIAMITSLDKLREPAAFWGWVNGITARRCKHLLTRGTKEWQIPEDDEGNSMLDSIETLDDQTVPDKVMDTAETQRLILDIIDGLPAEQRMTVTFFYYDEMSVKSIAEAMKVSEGTVKSRLNYARKTIKLEVEKLEKKDGTKLYSVSVLPFLAYFLRMEAKNQILSPGVASALTQGALAGARTSAGASATAGAAAASGTATGSAAGTSTAAGATAAAGAKVAGAVSAKVVAAVLAGALAVGGIGTVAYVASRQSGRPVAEPTQTAEVPSPTLGAPGEDAASAHAGQPYSAPYAQMVRELEENNSGLRYDLVYIDEDDVPELIASTEYNDMVNVYTVSGGELRVIREGWSAGRLGVPNYYPGMNAIREDYSMMGGDHMDTSYIFYRINDAFEVEEISRQDGELWGDDRDVVEGSTFGIPAKLVDRTPQPLAGTMDAPAILELLGEGETATETETPAGTDPASGGEDRSPESGSVDFDFTPYVGTYTADAQMMESYGVEKIGALTLYSDGVLSGGESYYSWSDTPISSIMRADQAPVRLLSGGDSKGGSGSYTLMLYEGSTKMEGNVIPLVEYYIIYPEGVPDDRGGDSGKVRILYADLTGGAWEMLFTKES